MARVKSSEVPLCCPTSMALTSKIRLVGKTKRGHRIAYFAGASVTELNKMF
jgi:hypothetical protein